jgi:hypothetical protein
MYHVERVLTLAGLLVKATHEWTSSFGVQCNACPATTMNAYRDPTNATSGSFDPFLSSINTPTPPWYSFDSAFARTLHTEHDCFLNKTLDGQHSTRRLSSDRLTRMRIGRVKMQAPIDAPQFGALRSVRLLCHAWHATAGPIGKIRETA